MIQSDSSDDSAIEPVDGTTPTTVEWVRRLHAREVRADALPPEVRRHCVQHLTIEGFSASEIAELMMISERTVQRDRDAARRAGAIEPTLQLADELLGEFHRLTLASIQRLTRLANDAGSTAYSRLWAEDTISRVYERFIRLAEKLGYLEHAASRRTHLRDTDPAYAKRFKEQNAALIKMVTQGFGG